MSDQIEEYIEEISKLLPYPSEKKKEVLSELQSDVISAMKDHPPDDSPENVFGKPREVAKNVSLSQDWHDIRAGWFVRFWAWFVDFMSIWVIISIYTIVGFGFMLLFVSWDQLMNEFNRWETTTFKDFFTPLSVFVMTVISIIAIVSFITFFLYNIILEYYYSKTIGKKIFGLTVVDLSGTKITLKQAIIRNLSKVAFDKFLPLFLPIDTILGILLEREEKPKYHKQRGLDALAETIVIKK